MSERRKRRKLERRKRKQEDEEGFPQVDSVLITFHLQELTPFQG